MLKFIKEKLLNKKVWIPYEIVDKNVKRSSKGTSCLAHEAKTASKTNIFTWLP